MLNKINALLTRIESKAKLKKCGKNFRTGHTCHIRGHSNIEIGDNFFAGPHLYMNTNSISKIKIGNDVMCGPYVKIISGNHIMDYKYGPMNSCPPKKPGDDKGIIIENDIWICVNAAILDGSLISEGAIIGANSVVSKYVPPYVIAAGNPLKVIRPRFKIEDLEILLTKKKSNISIQEVITSYKTNGIKIE